MVNHELKMRLELLFFLYSSAVRALNNKRLDHFKFLQMPFTSHPTAFYKSTTYSWTVCVYCRVPKTLKKPQPVQIKQWGQSIP